MDERMLKQSKQSTSNIIMEDRHRLSVSGVIDVISFDDETVVVDTELGALLVKGQGFRINKLNVDVGEISVEGEIDSATYEDSYSKPKGGFFARMFK